MINSLLNHLAPHYCCSCDGIGAVLCENCKYNIISEDFGRCILCMTAVYGKSLCQTCNDVFGQAWCVSSYEEEAEKLVKAMKFGCVREGAAIIAELLSLRIGQLPKGAIIVPVPTVRSHVRERGFDHTALIARYLAKLQNKECQHLLKRVTATKQRGAGREERLQNAKGAFQVSGLVKPQIPYLIVDDVMTTGATLLACANELKSAGALQVWVATFTRQTID